MIHNKTGCVSYTLSPPLAREANESILRMSAFHDEGVVFLNRMPRDEELSYKWDPIPVVVLGEIKSTHQWERFNGHGVTKGGSTHCVQVDLLEIVDGQVSLIDGGNGVMTPRSRRRKLLMGHRVFHTFKQELSSNEDLLMHVSVPPLGMLRNPHPSQFGRIRISGPVGDIVHGV